MVLQFLIFLTFCFFLLDMVFFPQKIYYWWSSRCWNLWMITLLYLSKINSMLLFRPLVFTSIKFIHSIPEAFYLILKFIPCPHVFFWFFQINLSNLMIHETRWNCLLKSKIFKYIFTLILFLTINNWGLAVMLRSWIKYYTNSLSPVLTKLTFRTVS